MNVRETQRAPFSYRWRMQDPLPLLPRRAILSSAATVLVAQCGFWGGVLSADAAPKLSFNRDVRPILSENCFACHGPDANERKGGLRLDTREAALKGGKSETPSLVPGKPDQSELLTRVTTHDAEDFMPPKKTGKSIKPEQVAVLRQWIAEGGEYEGHWAFTRPERPPVPATGALNPIDAFISKRLAAEGLKLAPEADKWTLLRRVTLDLTGVPPSPAEMDAFAKDASPDAYSKVVDRLLQSPRYGEHMAAQWLDFARYADSHGFQSDSSRQMWMWRDWVMSAFNRNKPFDEFTIEQLAGDLLPNPSSDQIIATGFNRNHRINGEGGLIREEWFIENVIDRVDTTGSTWMGLSLGCARCHDHKFDPISQKEFYQFFAFFNSIDETGILAGDGKNTPPVIEFPTATQTEQRAKLAAEMKAAQAAVKEAQAGDLVSQKRWEKEALAGDPQWTPLEPKDLKSAGGAQLAAEPGGAVFSSGPQPASDSYSVSAEVNVPQITGVKLELLPDDRLPAKGPGRHANGNPIVSEFRLNVTLKADGSQHEVVFRDPSATFSQKGWEVANAIDGKAETGWAISPQTGKPQAGVFVLTEPLPLRGGSAVLAFQIDQKYGSGALIGKFRLSVATAPVPNGAPADLVEILKTAPEKRSEAQKKRLVDFHKSRGGAVATAKAKEESVKKAQAALEKSIASTMVMRELATPRVANLLERGQYDKPGAAVERALPAALPPLPEGAPLNRLGLAKWLVSGEHPLTARVWVNRAWERFFGFGLVKSSENFGSQADWPSHPDLLDWLASEFVKPAAGVQLAGVPAHAWDMKALHKLIVTSATYRQSARSHQELLEKDPENRLLARGPRLRLTAEQLRDSALAVSGLLVEKPGGASVRPYMPAKVWDETSVYGDLLNYKHATDENLYRRTVYTIWKRTAAPPTSLAFDAPSRETCTVKRSRTNTPLQALAMLNEVTFVEAARKLAETMIREGGDTAPERIQWAFRRAANRPAQPSEIKLLESGLDRQLVRFQQNPDAAAKLVGFGESKPPADIPAAQLAAYTITANVLLNIDEFITR